jgi:hypothetical protein
MFLIFVTLIALVICQQKVGPQDNKQNVGGSQENKQQQDFQQMNVTEQLLAFVNNSQVQQTFSFKVQRSSSIETL